MDYRRFRNLNESAQTKKSEGSMSFGEAVKQIGAYNKPVDFEGKKTKLRESKSNKGNVFEIVYSDHTSKTVDGPTAAELIDDLEAFDRDDVLRVNLVKKNGDFDTIWTEEEGLFVSQGKLDQLINEGKSNSVVEELPRAKTKHLDDLYSITLDDMPFGGFTGTKEECKKKVAELKKGTDPRLVSRLGIKKGADVVVREDLKTKLKEQDMSLVPSNTRIANADSFLDAIIKATGNENYDDGDGYWETEGTTWCNRYLYYGNSLNNTSLVKDLCDVGSSKIPNANFYYVEDDMEDDPVSEIGYTLTL